MLPIEQNFKVKMHFPLRNNEGNNAYIYNNPCCMPDYNGLIWREIRLIENCCGVT
jgi:hypothetical protein